MVTAAPAARLPTRSHLRRAISDGDFWWSTGIEDTFISAPHSVTGRTLDEYELTGHYRRWREDIDLIASLGVRTARYGIPWYRIQPEPNRWDWEWADRPLERMLELGISPQVDLVHYGLPGWLEGAFLHPDYPSHVAEYAARVADRFKGQIHWYTSLNEPGVTAWYCGRIGWWPPNLASWRGFVAVLLSVAAGIQKSTRALRAVDPEIVVYHVDATDVTDTDDPSLEAETARRNARVLLPLDLVTGRVDRTHPLFDWLGQSGADTDVLELLREHSEVPDIAGINLYPLFSYRVMRRDHKDRPRTPARYRENGLVERIASGYWEHFRLPMAISEIATSGTPERRMRWLHDSVSQVRRLRESGIPVAGYTWWPMFALVPWRWRQGHADAADLLLQMGLWDLDSKLNRIRTPLVDEYASLVDKGAETVGALARVPPSLTDVQELLPRRF